MKRKEKLIVILGPTAVGKTDLSIALAQRLNTEIISGDSMLVYRGMDIGTAKPTQKEMAGIAHHLIDILNPEEEFSVTRFKESAAAKITAIQRRGSIPILAGGTGLYVKCLLEGYQFNAAPGDAAYRGALESLAEKNGKAHVHAMLAKVDPAAAARLHVNDFRRVVRALEVYHMGGETISRKKKSDGDSLIYDALVVGLSMERAHLYARINQRVDLMIKAGLVQEVARLLDEGIPADAQSMKGIGYKEIAAYLRGDVSLEGAVEQLKQSTRHFAKRQMTWFRKMPYITWYDAETCAPEALVNEVYGAAVKKFAL